MELFKTSLQPEKIPTTEWKADIHEESRVCGYCEGCWGWDALTNLTMAHPANAPQEHALFHLPCAFQTPGVEICTC